MLQLDIFHARALKICSAQYDYRVLHARQLIWRRLDEASAAGCCSAVAMPSLAGMPADTSVCISSRFPIGVNKKPLNSLSAARGRVQFGVGCVHLELQGAEASALGV